jgi:Leucine-rich repeat (LRR) protein
MKKLSYLNLNGNQLKKIPESIGELTNLTHLYFEPHFLKNLPSTIENLRQLNVLSLSKNLISFEEQLIMKALVPEGCEVIF